MNNNKVCLVCNSEKIAKLPNYYEKHALLKCEVCDFVFMEKIPSLNELSKHYSNYTYNSASVLSPLTIKSYHVLLDEFEKFRKTNKILDVGCGRGSFLIEAKKRGWEVFGTEYSDKAIEICENAGIEMKSGKLNTTLFDKKDFDIITSFEVIEHINNPNEEVENIKLLLRKGGLFYCTTPNFNSLLRYYLKTDYNVIEYPEHLSYYTKKTLNNLVKRHSFKLLKFLSTGISLTRIEAASKKVTPVVNTEDVKPVALISSDEKLRQSINDKWYLGIAKILVNTFLTYTNLGLTLKGYYIKQ